MNILSAAIVLLSCVLQACAQVAPTRRVEVEQLPAHSLTIQQPASSAASQGQMAEQPVPNTSWTVRLARVWEDGPVYYAQAMRGHLALWWRARPLEAWINSPEADPALAERLRLAQSIRRFASDRLALPDNGSYTRYVDLGRSHVVWNVKAAPELSLEPRRWCFPVAGCVAYRGFYDRADAEAFAARLRAGGDDVVVAGVPAYSTLGWMDDPLLSSFIQYPEADLAGLVFHELAHQRVYLKGDTRFNESFASAVEILGVRLWLEQRASATGDMSLLEAWQGRRERREQFLGILSRARERLDRLYRSGDEAAVLREGKREVIAALRKEWRDLRGRWGSGHGYDRWFEQDIGNAHLVSVALYSDLVPAFMAMAERHGGDLQLFYREVEALAREPESRRTARLRAIHEMSLRRP
jgi:predicted aminopeptidase